MVNTMASLTDGQVPGGSSVVMVRVTVPAVMSFADGVYVAASKDALSNDPVPEVVQVDEVALPPRVPDNV